MPQGLPRKLRFAFVLQVVMASIVIIAGTWVAMHYVRQAIASQALREEAAYFWAKRDADAAHAPPDEASLRGNYVSDGGSAAGWPQALRGLEPGLHELPDSLVLVDRRGDGQLYLTYPLVAAPRDRERVVMKASRFLEELPPEPELFERWQLEEGGGAPPLPEAAPPVALPARDPRVIPALFGAADEPEEPGGEGGDAPF